MNDWKQVEGIAFSCYTIDKSYSPACLLKGNWILSYEDCIFLKHSYDKNMTFIMCLHQYIYTSAIRIFNVQNKHNVQTYIQISTPTQAYLP